MAKRKCNPTSVRLSEELEEQLYERCNKLGCSKNDFIKNSVDFMLNNNSDFEFDLDDEEETNNPNLDNSKLEKEVYID